MVYNDGRLDSGDSAPPAMMPGDRQAKTAAVAADGTAGSCTNCSILHQSLTEYVSSFLALKQKITASDDAIRLQQQLEELQMHLVTLEKKTADYESVQAELEEKRSSLKAHEHLSEEMEKLKQENIITVTQNKKLEDQLKCVKDLTDVQLLENAQLKREKAAIENDLLQTQVSLKKSQEQAGKAEKLAEENAAMASLKESLENKVKLFEDSICKQNHQIFQLSKEKTLLERNIFDLRARLMKLEKERCKDFRSTRTQTSAEPKVDKEKVRMLLQSLWACVEQDQSADMLPFPESNCKKVLPSSPQSKLQTHARAKSLSASPKSRESHSFQIQTKATCTQLKSCTYAQEAIKNQASPLRSRGKERTDSQKKRKRSSKQQECDEPSADRSSPELSLYDILELFKPMLSCISPLPDLDTNINEESKDLDNEEKVHHHGPAEDSPHRLVALDITASLSKHNSPSFSAVQKTDSLDLMETTTCEPQPVSTEKNLGENGTSGASKLKDEPDKDHGKMHQQKDMLPEEDPASMDLASVPSVPLPSSSSTTDSWMHEVFSLTTESPESSCTSNINGGDPSNISGPENSVEQAKEDDSKSVTKTDVETSLGGAFDNKTVISNGEQLLRRSDEAVISEEADDENPDAPPKLKEVLKGITIRENSSEVEKSDVESCQDSKDSTAVEHMKSTGSLCRDSEVQEYTTSSTNDNVSATTTGNDNVSATTSGNDNVSATTTGNESATTTGNDNLSATTSGNGNVSATTTGNDNVSATTGNDNVSATPSGNDNVSATTSGNDNVSATPSSTDNVNCASIEDLDERMEVDAPIELPGEDDARDAAQENEGVNITTSNESNSDNKPLCLEKPLVLKRKDELVLKDFDIETLKSKVMTEDAPLIPESTETITVDCTSLEEKAHSLCQEQSPACAAPTLKTQPLETHPNTAESNVDDTEQIATNKSPPHVDQQSISEMDDVKDISQESIDAVSTALFVKNSDGTKQNNSLEPCAKARETSPCKIIYTSLQTAKYISHIRSEMGPPLPPALTPVSTPPRESKSINPRHAIGKLLFPSPMQEVVSPTTPSHTHVTPNGQQLNSSSFNSPVPLNGVPSSPLQFGSATPKHAVPVPGRLPLTAMNSSPSSASPPQENSMRILDTMYPELSARARTLSILRGNVNLSICSSESRTSPTTTDKQISVFKTISSTSTAFTKTEIRGEKRPAIGLSQAKNSKCQKLDGGSPGVTGKQASSVSSNSGDEIRPAQTLTVEQSSSNPSLKAEEPSSENLIVNSLKKVQNKCFDLLPVIQSHLYVGNLPKKPVLRDEEREVISDIYHRNLADDMILAILNKLKAEKRTLSPNYMQALCRVYTGLCRQNRDWEKARVLAYSILVEDFPDSAKLILFMVTTWPTFLSHSSSLCQAVHSITKLKAQEGFLNCLSAFLDWEKTPACNIDQLLSATLSELKSGSNLSFTKHSRYGEDLGTEAWEIIFTLHLLCSEKKWKWTYQNVIGNVLWPLLNTWVTQPKDQKSICDATIATVLRLVGRLGQLGLKERCVASVSTVASVINTFGRQGQVEGVPWEVQLAAVYCIYDLSPCDPKQALDVLAWWRGETTQCVPPAVTSCINQLGSICRQLNN
ncbi:little elongation complex subunit 1 [Cololabis saira]|uniref:little elongation complex subunit 1 n=1 Tax=Cololabis saira TaxID=129043 RepID=UPI002AD2F574|nr:little elongation complex subunit 1 [Cololabis saira]